MRRVAVVLLVLLGLTGAQPASAVYGGRDVSDSRNGFMAVIQVDGNLRCGGTVIASRYVLTAAHCLDGVDPATFVVRVGSLDRRGGTAVSVRRGVQHPRYRTSGGLYDAAVLELSRPVPEVVPRITLATAASDVLEKPGTPVVVAGWGALFFQGPSPNTMREAALKVKRDAACGDPSDPAVEVEVCAAAFAKSPCYGDSGGPLFYRGPRLTIQIGIVSHGSLPGCNEILLTQEAAFFTEVNNRDVRAFITSIAGV